MTSKRMVFLLLAVIVAGATAFMARAWLQSERAALIAQVGAPRGGAGARRPCRCWWRATPSIPARSSSPTICAGSRGPRAAWRRPISSKASGRCPTSSARWRAARSRAGEPITDGKLVLAGTRGFMAAVLQPGTRAVSVPITATTAVSGFIYAGDRVDVLLTHVLQR